MQVHGLEMSTTLEGLSGPVKKAASDLLAKQPGGGAASGVANGGSGRALPPVAAEPVPSSKLLSYHLLANTIHPPPSCPSSHSQYDVI